MELKGFSKEKNEVSMKRIMRITFLHTQKHLDGSMKHTEYFKRSPNLE